MRERLLLAAAGVAIGCAPAWAQSAPAYNWSGVYVGASAGYGWLDQSWRDQNWLIEYQREKYNLNRSGASIGGYVGYNFLVSPMFLVGLELDLSRAFDGENKAISSNVKAKGSSWTFHNDDTWTATARARAGIVIGRTLVFGTAGFAHTDSSTTLSRGGWSWKYGTESQSGRVVGAGVEHALTNNLLLRVEASHYDYGSQNAETLTPKSSQDYGLADYYKHKSTQTNTVVRAGMAYKF